MRDIVYKVPKCKLKKGLIGNKSWVIFLEEDAEVCVK
jgi:hypothetical protein